MNLITGYIAYSLLWVASEKPIFELIVICGLLLGKLDGMLATMADAVLPKLFDDTASAFSVSRFVVNVSVSATFFAQSAAGVREIMIALLIGVTLSTIAGYLLGREMSKKINLYLE